MHECRDRRRRLHRVREPSGERHDCGPRAADDDDRNCDYGGHATRPYAVRERRYVERVVDAPNRDENTGPEHRADAFHGEVAPCPAKRRVARPRRREQSGRARSGRNPGGGERPQIRCDGDFERARTCRGEESHKWRVRHRCALHRSARKAADDERDGRNRASDAPGERRCTGGGRHCSRSDRNPRCADDAERDRTIGSGDLQPNDDGDESRCRGRCGEQEREQPNLSNVSQASSARGGRNTQQGFA